MDSGREGSDSPDSYDVYVVVHPFAEAAAEFMESVRPLAGHEEEQLLGAEGYYCQSIDSAIVNLRFRREFVELQGTARVCELVSSWGHPLIAPEELTDAEREQFFLGHLTGYGTYSQHYPSHTESEPMLIRAVKSLLEHARASDTTARRQRLSTHSRAWLVRAATRHGTDEPGASRGSERLSTIRELELLDPEAWLNTRSQP